MLEEMGNPGVGIASRHCMCVVPSIHLCGLTRDRQKILEGAHLAVLRDVNGARLMDVALDDVRAVDEN